MVQQLSKDLRLHKSGFLALLAIMLGAFLFGMVLVSIIMYTDADSDTWFCMGTLLACIVLVVSGVIFAAFSYPQEFMLALSMGRTRKAFMVSYYVRIMLQLAVGWLLVLLLHQIELRTYTLMFYRYQNEVFFSFLTDWRVLVPVFLLLPIGGMFLGALYGKFGKKGLLLFYFLWLFCCIVLPRMFHEEPSEGALDQVAMGLLWTIQSVPVGVWIGIGTVALVGMTVSIFKFGMEQMVK